MAKRDPAYFRAWRQRNRERTAKYRLAHREQRAVNWRKTAERRKDHRAAVKALWHERNRERLNAKKKEWRDANPGWNLAADAKRRAVKKGATIGPPIDYAAVLAAANGICGLCELPFADEQPHFDHVIPLSKGGSHTQENLQAVHRRCNLRKAAKVPAHIRARG